MLNLRNRLPVDLLWPMRKSTTGEITYETFNDRTDPARRLRVFGKESLDEITAGENLLHIAEIYAGRFKALAFIVQYAQGVAPILRDGESVSQPVTLLHGRGFSDEGLMTPDGPQMDRLLAGLTDAAAW